MSFFRGIQCIRLHSILILLGLLLRPISGFVFVLEAPQPNTPTQPSSTCRGGKEDDLEKKRKKGGKEDGTGDGLCSHPWPQALPPLLRRSPAKKGGHLPSSSARRVVPRRLLSQTHLPSPPPPPPPPWLRLRPRSRRRRGRGRIRRKMISTIW
jgi:hypothetical protein